MSITSVKSGATGISLALDNNFMEPIATTLVGSGGVNQVTFNDIPQNYKHLQIRITSLLSAVNNIYAQVGNGSIDNGNNYAWHELYGDGASAAAGAGATQSFIKVTYQTSTTANYTSVAVVDLLDYANTNKYKTMRILSGSDANGSGYVFLRSGLWQSTNAITDIKLYGSTGSLNQYSRISLYGIKG